MENNTNLTNEITDLINRKEFFLAKDKLIKSNLIKDCYYHNTLGFLLQELGDFVEAEKQYLKSYKLNKNFLEPRFNQACLLLRKKLYHDAEKIFLELTSKNDEDYLSYYNLGIIKFEIKDYNSALIFFKKTSDIQINFYKAYHQIGLTYEKLGNFPEAINNYNTANSLNVDNSNISWNNLGAIYLKLKKFEKAFECFNKAINLNGDKSLIYNNIAGAYFEVGESFLGNTYMKKAAECDKNNSVIISRLLGTFPYNNYIFDDYKYWSGKFRTSIKNFEHNSEKISFNKKKLHLGFFGSDFINHPVGYFLLDMLPLIKLDNFDLYFYSNSSYEDDLSTKIKENLVKWENVSQKNTSEIFNIIKSDNIDILIDMSGHTNNGNLEIFANRAAPIQLSWASYLATTGINEIDYIIGDPYVTPINTKEYFSETILNLPNIWCSLSTSNISTLDTVDTPAIKNGYITYGSFNNLNKINNVVVKVWSNILTNNKNSKLIIKNSQLNHNLAKSILVEKFKKNGVSEEQLILEGSSAREDTLKKYNLIDIALDTFPWNGGTTSFELSWMCVPLLTLSGDRFMARCGESINRNLNMNDWITYNTNDYVYQAIKYSNNFDLLNKIRLNLRNFSRKSVLFDTKIFATNFLICLNKVVDFYKRKIN